MVLPVTGYFISNEDVTSVTALTDSKGRYRLQFPAYSDVEIIVTSSEYENYSPEVFYIKGKSADSWVQQPIELPCNECAWHGDTSVVINGVTWATRNVDAPGTFAATPGSYGMYYQWNRSTGWYCDNATLTGVLKGGGTTTTWDSSSSTGDEWESANDPSPAGWRVPTWDELQTLLDTATVSNKWTACNGVNGRLFTDKATGKSLFIPAAGYLYYNLDAGHSGSLNGASDLGFYWSSTQYNSGYAYYLNLTEGSLNRYSRTNVISIRCVSEL
jgi:uncharacterized protein (TIGR02145 family)